MKIFSDQNLRRDVLKLLFGLGALSALSYLFLFTPSLSSPTMISLVAVMLLSPGVTALERRGIPRSLSIGLIFLIFAGALAGGSVYVAQWLQGEVSSFRTSAPAYFEMFIEKVRLFEARLKIDYTFLSDIKLAENLVDLGKNSGAWFVSNSAGLAGSLATLSFIVPIITFVLLNEGPLLRKQFFTLIPNRYFESFFLVTYEIATAISDYLRAKLLEATLVGLMCWIGLALIGAPYALILGVVGGITNILPYLGPFLGAIPGLLVVAFDPTSSHLLAPAVVVYVVANVIDNVLIFPIVVAKLVNLHPLLLIGVVFFGQQYYGLVGMLISIPIASAIKVISIEVYSAIYEQGVRRRTKPVEDLPVNSAEV